MMIHAFNQVMNYIDEQLTDTINDEEIAKRAGVSAYQFRRMFAYLAGMPLNEYIKNRRLSLANQALVTGSSVTEVAFTFGYQSVEGFSRAFKEWSGFSPSAVAKNAIQKSFPKFTFALTIKGGTSMEFKIEQKDAFHLVGVSKRVPIQFEGENPAIAELAQSITPQQREEMHSLGDLYPQQVLQVSYDFDEGWLQEKGELTQFIGFATSKENPYEDLEQLAVPSLTWAIFPNQGPFPETLQGTWAAIYSEWLPSSGYELIEAPGISFTRYDDPRENTYSEIWVAVKKTAE